ncbi:MAG: pyridoxamine 5'-phosphate oxidase [Solirubrobacterales bacterium]
MPPLEREGLADDPVEQFRDWFELAEREAPLAEAMTLATVDADGAPNARMVLLKGFGPAGFRFFSNYESDKGTELDANPMAALVIYWRELDRQVRVRGEVRRLPAEDSDAYFRTRARDSRIAASVSPQSSPVDRDELDREFDAALAAGEDVPRPPHWGGYLLEPREIEFWQGRESRMHDRFRYARDDGGWRIERLAP